MIGFRSCLLLVAVSLSVAQPSAAQQANDQANYTVTILGLPAAQLAIVERRNGAQYAAAMQAKSSGLAGMFAHFSVDSRVRGTMVGEKRRPSHYMSTSDGDRGGRGAEIAYGDGLPVVQSLAGGDDPTAPKVDPSQQKGAVDPLTAVLSVASDQGAEHLCQQELRIFDGHRVASMALSGPINGTTTCRGVYQRLYGYPAAELAKRDRFTFEVDYIALPDGRMRMTELRLDSLFGLARLTRNAD